MLALAPTWAQDADSDGGNDSAERKTMERFQTVLERNPRRGTALDRVYGYHVEHGTLDSLVKRYDDRIKADKSDGAAWLLLGLVEAQRGKDAAAVTAFREAEKTRANDSLASFYLGQALVLVGQPDQAVDAFERALTKKPIRADLLEVYQALGRVHQRARRAEKALAVWTRLEAAFPDDTRVREQIAAALAEEDQPAQALARYQTLITDVRDEYRKVQLAMDAAELKVRLGKAPEALEDFGKLLGKLNPDSWMFKEVRRKIEEVFLRNDDLIGLAKYYEGWIVKTPDDVEAMARLGRTYAQLGRAADARSWLDKAVKLAPTRRDLRMTLIEQLVQEKKIDDAAAEYEKLAKTDPGNPDIIREWGKLLLRDGSKPIDQRKAAAAAVWKRLAGDDVKDAVTIAQAADLFRQAEMVDDAIALYKRAIALAPDSAQYREYLGEYYHQLKRRDDALATWRTGVGKTAAELGRLGEVLAGFGYRQEALDPLLQAVKLAPDDFDLRLKLADLYLQLDRPKDALPEVMAARKASSGPEQAEAVLGREIKTYQASKTLGDEIAKLQADLNAGKDATGERWSRLASFYEADGKTNEAIVAATSATKADPKSIPSWVALARLQEGSGNLGGAVDANHTLAGLDRRARADYLSAIARLESRLGRKAEALKAGRDLLAAAPGNSDRLQEFADLCFSLGENDEGLETLRRSARSNPTDPKATTTLAEALARQFRTEEAIELFWRSFDRTKELDAKLGIVSRLTDQYLQRNQFDRLIARLERELREPDRKRELTICLAQAYQAAGDLGAARQQLESLLTANPRDAALLFQLAQLAETEGDVASAARYQRQAVDIAPTPEATVKLAQLFMRAGEISEAEVVWSKLATNDQEAARAITAIDSLLTNSKYDTVVSLTERMLLKNPKDWEVLYREGFALQNKGKMPEALKRFQAILDLNGNDDDLSALMKARRKNPSGTSGAQAGVVASRNTSPYVFPAYTRINSAQQLRSVVGLDNRYYFGTNYIWSPTDFGSAREGAIAWLYAESQKDKNDSEAWTKARRAVIDSGKADKRTLWDWYYLQLIRNDNKEIFKASASLVRADGGDTAALMAFLTATANRGVDASQMYVRSTTNAKTDTTPPLPPADLQLVLDAFDSLKKRRPDLLLPNFVTTVNTELKRAKRENDVAAFYKAAMASANTLETVSSALDYAADQGSLDDLFSLADKYERLQLANPRGNLSNRPLAQGLATSFGRAMGVKADTKDHAAILKILDHYLASSWKPDQMAARQKSSTSSMVRGQAAYFYVYMTKPSPTQNTRYTQVDFPSPNAYFDLGAIQLLRNTYEIFKRDDVVSDLMNRFRSDITKAPANAKIFPTLALTYLLWWNDEKEESLREFGRGCDLVKNDIDLRLNFAEMRAQRGEAAEALETVDQVEPLDQKTMQRRETLALRLSVLSGDIQRARKAAERLFGLRLDSDTQIQLAGQMNQLGMHDLSEAVMARARRSAGGNSTVLVNLMNQYQSQGKADIAVQVANQIMRQTSGSRNAQPGSVTVNDQARMAAVQLFSRSGKLKDLIARAEAQLESSPNSPALLQTLVDYYQADQQRDKVKATYARLAKLKAEDPRALFQIAIDLSRAGASNEALELYRTSLKKDPSLFANQYYEVQRAFQQAGKTDELIKLYDSMDFKTFRNNPYVIQNTINELMQNEKTRDQAMVLFRKAWKELPQVRTQLIGNLYNDEFWKVAEIFDYAREAVIPKPGAAINDAWAGLEEIDSYGGDGTVNGVLTRLFQAAERQNKLDTLVKEVDAALARTPEWTGGRALSAILKAKRGQVQEAHKDFEALLSSGKEIPSSARMLVSQELGKIASLKDIELKLLEEGALDNEMARNNGFQYGPGRRLVTLYQKNGRVNDARDLLMKYAANRGNFDGYDPSYAAYRRIQDGMTVAQLLNELGYPAEAARFYNDLANDPDSITNARQYYGNSDQILLQVRRGMEQSLGQMNAQTAERTVRTLLTPRPNRKETDLVLDLVVLCHPREIDKTGMLCVFAEAVNPKTATSAIRTEAKELLAKLEKAHPTDLSVLTALAILAGQESKPDDLAAVAAKLAKFVETHPLDALPASGRPNGRQRQEAEQQLMLWVAARLCLAHDATRSNGEILTARVLEAARRQSDSRWSLAILRESSQNAFDRGDKKAAEEAWRNMLRLVLAAPVPKSASGTGGTTGTISVLPRTAVVQSSGPITMTKAAVRLNAGTASDAIVVTLERFEQVVQLAKLFAAHDQTALSVDAVKQALATGPPVTPMVVTNANQRVYSSGNMNPADAAAAQTSLRVEENLNTLERIWTQKKADPAAVYGVLKDAVFPVSRPKEIFLYTRPSNPNQDNIQPLRSVSTLLVRWANQANKAEDLRQTIAAREKQPLAQAPAKVLRGQLEFALKNYPATNAVLDEIRQGTSKDGLNVSSEMTFLIALPTLDVKETADASAKLFESALGRLNAPGNSDETGANFQMRLARHYFDVDRPADAKRLLLAYLTRIQEAYSRYSGDYIFYRRKLGLGNVATEFALHGQLADALDMLGQYEDLPLSANYGLMSNGRAVRAVLDLLDALPVAERYKIVKTWMLPSENRRSVRWEVTLVNANVGNQGNTAANGKHGERGLYAMSTVLIDAAKELKQLDALAHEVRPLVEKKVEHADDLMNQIEIVRGNTKDAVAVLNARSIELKKPAVPDQYRGMPQVSLTDYLLLRHSFDSTDPALNAAAEAMWPNLMARAQSAQNYQLIGDLRRDLAYFTTKRAGKLDLALAGDPELPLWHPRASNLFSGNEGPGSRAIWAESNGIVAHVAGQGEDFFMFRYPLIGTFEISIDAYNGGHSEGQIGYSGLISEPSNFGNNSTIHTVGQDDRVQLPAPAIRGESFNQMKIRVEPGKVSYFNNGHLFYEDKTPAITSPWLFLRSSRERAPAFRNAVITGQPQIPREVALVQGDRLDGWVTGNMLGGQLAPRRRPEELVSRQAMNLGIMDITPPKPSWSAHDGELVGIREPQPGVDNPPANRIVYTRPLESGDELSYEFFYKPSETMVHPTLGGFAFVIEPAGLKLRPLRSTNDEYYNYNPNVNAPKPPKPDQTDAAGKRGEIALKADAWNQASLRVTGKTLAITLNGTKIYEREIDPEDSDFGFYHKLPEGNARLRKIVLKGDWPAALKPEQMANLFQRDPAKPRDRATLAASAVLVSEKYLVLEGSELIERTRKLPAAQRYDQLLAWVLPNVDHTTLRLVSRYGQTALPNEGTLESPAIALVAAAKEANKLDALASLVTETKVINDLDRRGRLALLAMIRHAQNNVPEAGKLLGELKTLAEKAIVKETPDAERWPELVVATALLSETRLNGEVFALLDMLVNQIQQTQYWSDLERHVRVVHGRAKLAKLAQSNPGPIPGWIPAVVDNCEKNGLGYPAPVWTYKNGEWTHYPGHDHDFLFLNTPLLGDFEVTCDLSSFGWREARISYGGLTIGLLYTAKGYEILHYGYSIALNGVIDPPLADVKDFYSFKLVVKGNLATVYMSGRKIHEQAVSREQSPWLALYALSQSTATFRNLKISGKPVVPAVISLSGTSDLNGWLGNYYGEPVEGEAAYWQKRGEEIIGRRLDPKMDLSQRNNRSGQPARMHPEAIAGSKIETLLRYARPLAEDCEVEYEFYYDGSGTQVAPALGRTAFLIEPDGLTLHRITEGKFERSGLDPANATPVAADRRGPLALKPKAWNKIKLATKGDRVTITLNDAAIHEHQIKPGDTREFGFFHYADESEARVRNVRLTGMWPKAVARELMETQQTALAPAAAKP